MLSDEAMKVAQLERLYLSYQNDPALATQAISAMRQLDADLAWRAAWLLKRLARAGKLCEEDLVRLANCADEMDHWAARLNLCQLFGTTGCPVSAREALYPFLVDCFANRRPMIRAWAISTLAGFRDDPKYRKPVAAMLRKARGDTAGSVVARLRHCD